MPAALSIWTVLAATESVGLKVLFVFLVGLLALVLLVLLFVPLYITRQLALRELVVGGEEDITNGITYAVTQPQRVDVNEIS